MKTSFMLAWRGLWRGKSLWVLIASVLAAHLLLPGLVRSDGSDAGRLEMHVRVVCGAVAALIYLATLAMACGSIARDREDDILPLSLVRPVSAFSSVAGRWLALVLQAAIVLVVNAVLVNVMLGASDHAPGSCRVHHSPALPPAEVAAARMMDMFLKSDKTPDEVKKAPRTAVLALLAAKENERYEVVHPGGVLSLPFDVPVGEPLTVKVRFSTMYNIQEALSGTFFYRGFEGSVSNSTQSVVEVPLSCQTPGFGTWLDPNAIPTTNPDALTFKNTGRTDVMLRPRRDIELLAPGDAFLLNSLRAALEMLALCGLLAAFGLFLSAALSRPVALFTSAVLLAAAMMAPDAVSQFPDEFNATLGEKIGLAISRTVTRFTASLYEPSPVSDLASARAIQIPGLLKMAASDLLAWPALFLSLAAFVLRRK